MEPVVTLSLASYTPEQLVDELARALDEAGLESRVSRRPPEMTMALEWIVPTAIILYVAKTFFGEMLKVAGKAAGEAALEKLKSTVASVSTRDRVFDPRVLVGGRGTARPYSNCSMVVPSRVGKQLVFLFPIDGERQVYGPAVERVLELSSEHLSRNDSTDRLSKYIEAAAREPGNSVYFKYEVGQSEWRYIDTMEEVRKAARRQESAID